MKSKGLQSVEQAKPSKKGTMLRKQPVAIEKRTHYLGYKVERSTPRFLLYHLFVILQESALKTRHVLRSWDG